ncbi:MAG: hypothetical protein D6689_01180, partial [Deltaproteobacteria bacterium]
SEAAAAASGEAAAASGEPAAGPNGGAAPGAGAVAAAFTAEEEEFFRKGAMLHKQPQEPVESFDDLDVEPPKTFWQRLVSRPDAVRRLDSEPILLPARDADDD